MSSVRGLLPGPPALPDAQSWRPALRYPTRRARLTCAVLASSFLLDTGAGGAASAVDSAAASPAASPETIIRVTTEEELRRAVAAAPSRATVVLAPGVYRLLWPLEIRSAADLVVRGETAAKDVVIEGPGLLSADTAVPRAFVVGGRRVTITNLTIRDFPDAAIVIERRAVAPRVSGVSFIDNRGAIRVAGTPRQPVVGGVIERSRVQWSVPVAQPTLPAVEVSGTSRLVIRQNAFLDLRSLAESPAVTLRLSAGVTGAVVEANTFVNCEQEVVIGAGDRRASLPSEVIVRNNVISRGTAPAGAALTLAGTSGGRVVHNTILLNGSHANAVELRYSTTSRALVRNNLLDAPVALLEGASGSTDGNLTTASPEYFVDAAAGDLHLTAAAAGVIDAAAAVPADLAATDLDGEPRVMGRIADYGADEFAAGQPAPAAATAEEPLAPADAEAGTLEASATTIAAASTEATATTTSLPTPWASGDIGSPALSGSAAYSSGTFTVKGAGKDIWGTSDQFRFVYRSLSGDGQIVARVASLQKTHAWAKAGVMMRRSLYPGSPHAFALVSAGSGVSFQQRTVGKGTSSTVASGSGAAPVWLRIVRKGSQFTASRSTDGATWKVMGTTTVSMPSTIYVGLAVTSHNASARTTASFSNVAFKTATTSSNSLPSVSVTSPASGQTFTAPAVVTVTASAADGDGTISKVEFYRGSTLIGTDTSSPYSASTGSLSAGTYSLTAVAQDNAGGRRTSAAVSITVASGSTTTVPKTLTFSPSPDHGTVTKYVFEVFKAGANPSTATPAKTQDLGKPAVVNGSITVSVGTTIQALPSGSYFATVRAVNAAGWSRSAPSNTFTR